MERHLKNGADHEARQPKGQLSRQLTAIPLPPLPEQKRIAAILDAADALRAKRRESIKQLDALIQSTFIDMFGDPVTNPMGWPTWGALADLLTTRVTVWHSARKSRMERIWSVPDAVRMQ
jgi:hypothetical protein